MIVERKKHPAFYAKHEMKKRLGLEAARTYRIGPPRAIKDPFPFRNHRTMKQIMLWEAAAEAIDKLRRKISAPA